MDTVLTAIAEWLKGLFADTIIFYLKNMFDLLDPIVTSAATEIGKSPDQWNPTVFQLVQNVSEIVIMPIAGMILTALACYELIHLVISKNSMQDFDTFIFFKWIFKTAVSVLILTNAFSIVMGIFEVAQHVITYSGAVIGTSVRLSGIDTDGYREVLMSKELGELVVVSMQVNFMLIMAWIMSFIVYIIVFGRMLEIYLMVSLAPIPLATLTSDNHQINVGINYLKSLFALGFQGFLMIVCIGIYVALLQTVASLSDPLNVGWSCVVFSGFLCYGLFQTGRLTKTVFNAHG